MFKNLLKYYADILEKMSVGALCIGLFQKERLGVIIGVTSFVLWQILRCLEIKVRTKKEG